MRIIRATLLVALVSLTDCHVGGGAASSRARVSSTTAVALEILPAVPGGPVGAGAAAFAHGLDVAHGGLDGAHGRVRFEGKNNYMGKRVPPAVGTRSGAGRPRAEFEHHLMSPASMRDALRGLGLDVSAMDAHALLRRFDGDRNGGLDVREFARVGRQPAPRPAPLSRPREFAGVGAVVVEDGVVNGGAPTRAGAAVADAAVAKAMVDALEGLMTLMVQNSATITGDATLNTLFRGFAGRGRRGERGEREMGSRTMYEREGKSPAPEGAGADASDDTNADADTADADADADTAAASYAAPEPDTTDGAELSFLEVGALTHNLGASSVKGRHAHSARSEHQDAASKDGLAQALAAGNFAKLIQMQQRQQSEMQREFASQREEIALLKKEYHHDHDAQVRGGFFWGEGSGGRTAV